MKQQVLSAVFLAAFTLQGSNVLAGAEDDAYFAAMERMAREADAQTSERLMEETRVDVEARMGELRRISPSAWATYKRLRPSYKEEVRKAIRADKDIYSVIELIFERNS
ncbi:hypothetical protein [Thiolapillus sp.]